MIIEGVDDTGDPRLRGRTWAIENKDIYTDSGGPVGVAIAGIDNEGGSWRGTLYGDVTQSGSPDNLSLLTGDGDYEGQSAIMFARCNNTDCDVHGMVYPGALPTRVTPSKRIPCLSREPRYRPRRRAC